MEMKKPLHMRFECQVGFKAETFSSFAGFFDRTLAIGRFT